MSFRESPITMAKPGSYIHIFHYLRMVLMFFILICSLWGSQLFASTSSPMKSISSKSFGKVERSKIAKLRSKTSKVRIAKSNFGRFNKKQGFATKKPALLAVAEPKQNLKKKMKGCPPGKSSCNLERRSTRLKRGDCALLYSDLGPDKEAWQQEGYSSRNYHFCMKRIWLAHKKSRSLSTLSSNTAENEYTNSEDTRFASLGGSLIGANVSSEIKSSKQFDALYLDLVLSPLNLLVVPSYGLGASLKLSDRWRVGYNYMYGSIQLGTALELAGVDTTVKLRDDRKTLERDVNKTIDDIEQLEIHHDKHIINASYFMGKTFFATAGIGVRSIGISYPWDDVADLNGAKASFYVSRPGIQFGIGNRWEWTYSSLVIDWLDFFVPFSAAEEFSFVDEKGEGGFNEFSSSPDGSILRVGYGLVLR